MHCERVNIVDDVSVGVITVLFRFSAAYNGNADRENCIVQSGLPFEFIRLTWGTLFCKRSFVITRDVYMCIGMTKASPRALTTWKLMGP
jgi:hypothetical protein